MITVANRTETAARIKYAFDHKKIHIDELCDPERTLHIDSKVLDEAEAAEEPIAADRAARTRTKRTTTASRARKLTKKQQAEFLAAAGRHRRAGRASPASRFRTSSRSGCCRKAGTPRPSRTSWACAPSPASFCASRWSAAACGARPTSSTRRRACSMPEYVNIFGVPFTFLPHEVGGRRAAAAAASRRRRSSRIPTKAEFEITWPNVIRIDHVYRPRLSLDLDEGEAAGAQRQPDARSSPSLPPSWRASRTSPRSPQIDLERLAREFRTQKIIFETARDVYDQMQKDWKGSKEFLLAQLVRLVEQFIRSDKITHHPGALPSGRPQAPPDHHPEHDQGGAAYLGGDPLREHRDA